MLNKDSDRRHEQTYIDPKKIVVISKFLVYVLGPALVFIAHDLVYAV